ncbi:MAG: ABC transporter ATP-binding protein [Agathobacter sp.]|nr:ABC transporter ATP-binding protein [Agathobacter sp.]MDY5103359.1 ABC transporter ATP-binding protein [Agathobacter sp.]
MNELKVRGLCKILKKTVVLDDIKIELKGGTITGIVGENGSGKSMLFRLLSGLVKPTEGEVLYNGEPLQVVEPNIGLVMDDVSMYPELTGRKNLELLAEIRHKIGKTQIDSALQRVGLDPEDKRIFRKYSLGMKHRLLLAQAIMEQPDFLFLDEPTNAIDVDGVQVFYKIIREEAKRGAIVLVSSHINSDIRELADEVYQMDHGKLTKINFVS